MHLLKLPMLQLVQVLNWCECVHVSKMNVSDLKHSLVMSVCALATTTKKQPFQASLWVSLDSFVSINNTPVYT